MELRWFYPLLLFISTLSVNKAHANYSGLEQTPARLTVATGEHYSPYVDQGLPDGGWSVSLVMQIFKTMSINAHLEVLPWARALEWTKQGKVLGAFPYVYSSKRSKDLLFSEPINFVPVYIYVSHFSALRSFEQLRGKSLCFPYDYSLSQLEEQVVKRFDMSIHRVKDGKGCLVHVQKGWSDAALINGYIDAGKLSFVAGEQHALYVFPEQVALVPLHFVISKQRKDAQLWIDEFNNALSIITENGKKQAIDNKFHTLFGVP
jgi:polar amino acid transport system substrate-binding protein